MRGVLVYQHNNLSIMKINCNGKILDLSRARVMGILNTTPDSFSDGGRFTVLDAARQQALQMLEEGADIIREEESIVKEEPKIVSKMVDFLFQKRTLYLILILLLLPPVLSGGRTKQCAYCAKIINESDRACKYCSREQPINLVQCKECGSYVPEKHSCEQCNKKMKS